MVIEYQHGSKIVLFYFFLSFTEKKVTKESRPKIQINGFVVAQACATGAQSH
jgi:hypothetical protein